MFIAYPGRIISAARAARPLLPRVAVLGLLASVWVLGFMPESHGQSRLCRQIDAELAALSNRRDVRGSLKYRRYVKAVQDQKIQIKKTQRIARRSGCRAGAAFSAPRNSGCKRILRTLNQMQANLENLESGRDQLAPKAGTRSRERRRLERAQQFNNCNSAQTQIAERQTNNKPRRRTLIEQIFGVRTFREDGNRGHRIDPTADMLDRFSGTYRTLCVRSCDGYYFPISFSTVPDRFEHDDAICQSMCPGTEVALYFHQIPAQDSEDMISYRTDLPYANMANAFSYRKQVNNECGCKFSSAILDGHGDYQVTEPIDKTEIKPQSEEKPVPRPTFRIDPAIDPETFRNRRGRLTETVVAGLLADHPDQRLADAPGGRKIRIVGPAFFAVQ